MRSFFTENRKGSTLVLIVISMSVLLGCTVLTVDVGHMYSVKAKLVTAADASALAGAYKLRNGTTAVKDRAVEIAGDNGVEAENVNVSVDTVNNQVTVIVTEEVRLFFAVIFGQGSTEVSATAVAKEAPPGGVNGMIPIGVTRADWETLMDPATGKVDETQEIEIKLDAHSNGASAGNFHAVDFPEGSGGSGYKEFLAQGYDGLIYLGQTFDTETGVMGGPTKEGITGRIGSCTCNDPHTCAISCSECSDIPPDDRDGIKCARLAIIPLLNTFEVNGKKQVTVEGFAAIFIREITGAKVYGSFVNDIITPEGRLLTDTQPGGVAIIKLVE